MMVLAYHQCDLSSFLLDIRKKTYEGLKDGDEGYSNLFMGSS